MYSVELQEIVDNEDGSTTYSFEVDENSAKVMAELGLRLLLYCGVCGVDTEEVFEYISTHVEEKDDE